MVEAWDTLSISFGPVGSPIDGFETVSKPNENPFTLFSQPYFGSAKFGYWYPPSGVTETHHADSAINTSVVVLPATYFCIIGVPVGSYRMQVTAGDAVLSSTSCFELPDGSRIIDDGMVAGQHRTLAATYHHLESYGKCLSLASCATSQINIWSITRLVCHESCAFCVGAGDSDCAIGCKGARALVTGEDGATYCL